MWYNIDLQKSDAARERVRGPGKGAKHMEQKRSKRGAPPTVPVGRDAKGPTGKIRAISMFLALAMLLPLGAPAFASEGADSAGGETIRHAVYLGVQDYGAVNDQTPGLANFLHKFSVDGETRAYPVSTGEAEGYALQNLLNEGYVYDVTVQGGAVTAVSAPQPTAEGRVVETSAEGITVATMDGEARRSVSGIRAVYEITTAAGETRAEEKALADVAVGDTVKVYGDTVYLTFVAEPYAPPVKGAPGVRTVKGFLSNAASGVGTALYIYGGGWVWQDETIQGSERWSNPQTRTIGVPQTWIDFFQRQDETFVYRNDDDPAHDYYSVRNNYNQYGYAGVDCSAFVGWSVYNTLNTASGQEDRPYYAGKSRTRAYYLAENGFGTIDNTYASAADFRPGDVFSMSGHVWICLGTCADGSMVILHSTPSPNKVNGRGGGGAQIASVGPEGSEAQALARHYMERYYPAWWALYTPVNNSFDAYTDRGSNGSGKFSWNILADAGGDGQGLADPEGYLDMSAAEILADLFGEAAGADLPQAPEAHECSARAFADVDLDAWYHAGVDYALEHGWMTGVSDAAFGPDLPVSRGAAVALLYDLAGRPAPTAPNPFSDVAEGSRYAAPAAWAAENGVARGYGDGRFGPEDPVTREQLAAMLYAYAARVGDDVSGRADLSAYADRASVSGWAATALSWAASGGLLRGAAGALSPRRGVTRAQAAVILTRFCQNGIPG